MRRSLAERVERHLGLHDAKLPRGMPWLYAVFAVIGVPVFSANVFHLSPELQIQAVLGNVLPFVLLPAAAHALYAFGMPSLLEAAKTPARRIAVHVVASALVAATTGLLLGLFVSSLGWHRAPLSGFVLRSVVMTWAFLFPAKLVVAWRDRASKSDQKRLLAERASARNELYAIQSRAHPHFLFNAINTVATLIPEDPQLAEETLVRFADVLRYILETSTVPSTPLERDLAVLREYLEIQRARFEHLQYSIDVAPGLDDVHAPPLVLLPLVENAVLHGASSSAAGRVHIRARQKEGHLALQVEDDGPGSGGASSHKVHRNGTGTALRDLRRRLELVYGDTARLVTSRRGEAARGELRHVVELHLPLGGGELS